MQELNVQPTNPTPYTPAGGTYNFNPTPGAGGLPALSGLSRNVNPMAQELQAQGRGQDSMLVHMTPDEVNDLQTLAMHSGTTMTINPNTGLPEAGLLGKVFKKLLPSLIGAGLMFIPGVNAIAAAGIVGGGSTLLTGSLKKGLMAGLQAYGGASLARGLGAGVQAAKNVTPLATSGGLGAKAGITAAENAYFTSLGGTAVPAVGSAATGAAAAAAPSITAAEQAFLTKAGGQFVPQAAKTGIAALPGNFANAAKASVPKFLAKAAPMAAGLGLVNTAGGVADATRKPGEAPVDQNNWPQEGPYMPTRRTLAPRLTGPGGRGEIMYFDQPDFGGYMTASGELRGLGAAPAQESYASQGLLGFAEGGDTKAASTSTNAGGLSRQRQFQENLTNIGQKNWANAYYDFQKTLLGTVPTETRYALEVQVNDTIKNRAFKDVDEWKSYLNTVASSALKPPATVRAAETVRAPGATPSGYGVETLKETYTPQFTKVEDFVTERVNPYRGGTQQTAKLADYISSYQTSPGPVTASLDYAAGQSPSQRNRAYALELARQAEERRKAATVPATTVSGATGTTGTTNTTAVTGATGTTGTNTNTFYNPIAGTNAGTYYYNPADGKMYMTPDFSGYVFDPVTGTFGPLNETRGPNRASGGSIHMDDGAFVVDARTVSELGNGSSSAGQELLARLGGRPVKGPGDGVSDSIRANIGGRQEARVARDEVIFPAAAVKKLGGAKKLYALMDKAHKARKKAGRGSDTKLRNGLGAL